MLRKRIASFSLTIFGVDLFPSYDVVDPKSPTAQKLTERIEVIKRTETGWDRLKSIFKREYLLHFSWGHHSFQWYILLLVISEILVPS